MIQATKIIFHLTQAVIVLAIICMHVSLVNVHCLVIFISSMIILSQWCFHRAEIRTLEEVKVVLHYASETKTSLT